MKTPIEKLMDEVDYKPIESIPNERGLPYVTHEGVLTIDDISIKVCVLNSGQRIIPSEELERVMPGITELAKEHGFEEQTFVKHSA